MTWAAGAAAVLCCAVAEAKTGKELYAEANARIEKHRKADAVVSVVDAAGKPVADARVKVEQTRHAFLFGSNIYLWGRVGDATDEAAYRKRFADLFNYATLGFYWASYERRRGQPRHERTTQIAQWCKENGIVTKGHPLAWNHADPPWLGDDFEEIRKLQVARIDDCVSRFKGLIDRWDVVNEATHFDRDSFKERAPKMTAMWSHVGKHPFVRECFTHARRANPSATLLINDYRTDPAYLPVIEKLVDENSKRMYDVIGIQSHMHGGPWSNDKIWKVCERFARFGVPLHFTETTILSGKQGWKLREKGQPWPSTPEGEATQAREVERFYTMLFSHPAVEALTWWDFSDRHAWQQAPAGFLRKDMSPKPAYERLMQLIKGAWWTVETVTSDKNGSAPFRGFFGDYRVSVRTKEGKTVTVPMTLAKSRPNRLSVTVN